MIKEIRDIGWIRMNHSIVDFDIDLLCIIYCEFKDEINGKYDIREETGKYRPNIHEVNRSLFYMTIIEDKLCWGSDHFKGVNKVSVLRGLGVC